MAYAFRIDVPGRFKGRFFRSRGTGRLHLLDDAGFHYQPESWIPEADTTACNLLAQWIETVGKDRPARDVLLVREFIAHCRVHIECRFDCLRDPELRPNVIGPGTGQPDAASTVVTLTTDHDCAGEGGDAATRTVDNGLDPTRNLRARETDPRRQAG